MVKILTRLFHRIASTFANGFSSVQTLQRRETPEKCVKSLCVIFGDYSPASAGTPARIFAHVPPTSSKAYTSPVSTSRNSDPVTIPAVGLLSVDSPAYLTSSLFPSITRAFRIRTNHFAPFLLVRLVAVFSPFSGDFTAFSVAGVLLPGTKSAGSFSPHFKQIFTQLTHLIASCAQAMSHPPFFAIKKAAVAAYLSNTPYVDCTMSPPSVNSRIL